MVRCKSEIRSKLTVGHVEVVECVALEPDILLHPRDVRICARPGDGRSRRQHSRKPSAVKQRSCTH